MKFSKRVENTVGKGGIARYEQFLLFPQCFQKTCKNKGLFGKGLRFKCIASLSPGSLLSIPDNKSTLMKALDNGLLFCFFPKIC